jgi:hypothetical protein
MKRLWLGVGAAALILASVATDTASARIGIGGVRVGGIGGFRGVGFGGIRGGFVRPGIGVGFVRPGLGWRAGWGGWGWRRGWGWPVAAGVAVGVAAAGWGYGSPCLAWNGWTWVNVCYSPYPYYGW